MGKVDSKESIWSESEIDRETKEFRMNDNDFMKIVERRIDLIRSVLASKSAEYSVPQDKLHAFRMASAITGGGLPRSCVGMMVKHLVSILDFVNHDRVPTQEQAEEKIGDLINYLIILEAIFSDMRSQPTHT